MGAFSNARPTLSCPQLSQGCSATWVMVSGFTSCSGTGFLLHLCGPDVGEQTSLAGIGTGHGPPALVPSPMLLLVPPSSLQPPWRLQGLSDLLSC